MNTEKPVYIAVNSADLIEFVNDVNNEIMDSYTPLGGVATTVTTDGDGYETQYFTQALVLVPTTTTL